MTNKKDNGRIQWVTLKDDGVTAETITIEPMTTAARRAKADVMAIIPDSSEM